ncbi:MAG: hypothetical protein ABJC13_08120 [Acidobacteriota bacterium]
MAIWKAAGGVPKPEIYTRLAAELAAGRDPDPALLETLLAKLRTDLVREIQRRSLWHSNPSYLGIHGFRNWSDSSGARGSSPVDELLLEAFTTLFLERLPTLRGYLDQGSAIDALIPHMLRNFIHDAQTRNDRLGTRLFRLLRAAVRQAETRGALEVVGGDARVTGGTLVRVAEGLDGGSEEERRERLVEKVARWNDEILGDLVAAPNRRVPEVVARLADLLAELGAAGVGSFSFGELIGAVRFDTRRRWTALFDSELGEIAWEDEEEPEEWENLCRAVEPEVEERLMAEDSFRHLIDCVARHIEEMEAPERTRDHLYRLWGFLRAFATEETPALPRKRANESLGERAGRLPSRRGLARWLGLPRDRFAELFATLGGFLTHCRHGDALEGGARP